MLSLAGYDVRIGLPSEGDSVGVWGQSPTSPRGTAIAQMRDAPVIRVEDAFLRSVLPGRDKEPPLGLMIDHQGVHFDPAPPSDLETLLATDPLDDPAILARAEAAISRIKFAHLTKYCAVDPDSPVPEPGFVLVIDQTRGDASVTASGADETTFHAMLAQARADNPDARIVIKTHPETARGHRVGYFDPEDAQGLVSLLSTPVSPWRLFEAAAAVYTVSSGLGFEAILAGHRPHVFGQPFYAGWGLSEDRVTHPRRGRVLTAEQLFAGAMIHYPIWYDPYRDQLCEIEDVILALSAQARAWREDHKGWVASGMSHWKRPALQKFFGQYEPMAFADPLETAQRKGAGSGKQVMAWSSKLADQTPSGAVTRVEDGFVRSKGLGAALTPPLSLVTDRTGIYYDPTAASDLERLITEAAHLPLAEIERSRALISALVAAGLSKYNIGASEGPALPEGHKILVPGQVEDDASILKGAGTVRRNRDLLAQVRQANPDAVVIYKPHPDVVAGLRKGDVEAEDLARFADLVVPDADPIHLIEMVDEVWTMTSTLGFEALLRGVPVTCLGVPFYAGWGLTRDLGQVPGRRHARPRLEGLAHAVLIGYARYLDPVTGLPCPPEVVIHRLAQGDMPAPSPGRRLMSVLNRWIAPRRR